MQELFTRFGLDSKESASYLELIRLGATPVSKWAKHAGINRSSMYVILERLTNAGLVATFTHNGVQHVQSVPLAELTALLNDKEDFIINTKTLLEKKLPELQKLEKTQGITPKVRFFEGIKKVELMYEEVLKEISFKAFFHPGRVKSKMPEYFHKIPQTLKTRGGKAQELLVSCKEADEYMSLYRSDKHKIALLPKDTTFSSDTIITNQKIYLIGYSISDAVGTEVWNEELAQTQSAIFDLVWNGPRLS
ncbi:MAG: helix-turn-helix domain-containing protein [Patescibacteria group bacterium]